MDYVEFDHGLDNPIINPYFQCRLHSIRFGTFLNMVWYIPQYVHSRYIKTRENFSARLLTERAEL